MGSRRRFTLYVDLAAAEAILNRFEIPGPPASIGRLDGGSAEVYRIDLAGNGPALVLKLYPDEPEWRPAKEQLVTLPHSLLAEALAGKTLDSQPR